MTNGMQMTQISESRQENSTQETIDRRGFLKCMAWAGTGLVWSFSGGVLAGCQPVAPVSKTQQIADFSFVQISDSHIGFNKAPNQDVTATFQEAIAQINSLSTPPAFMIHTGDLTHLAKVDEFDTVDQILKTAKASELFYVPGEHDVFTDNGKSFLDRYGKGTVGDGWRSFDYNGVHFVGLINVLNLKAGGLGALGEAQLDWLTKDLQVLSKSTPIVVYAHVPLWTVYPQWGWGTDDGARALDLVKGFGSVTVLNGHIHQILQKVEGNITFHTARSTAFPQPAPGAAKAPGPMVDVPAEKLRAMLGITAVDYTEHNSTLAIIDSTLDKKAGGA